MSGKCDEYTCDAMSTMTREEIANIESKYGSIIRRERPHDPSSMMKHPPMSNEGRAKIFSPFAALRGHNDRLRVEDRRLMRKTKTTLSDESADRLSDMLAQVSKGMPVGVRYFKEDDRRSGMGYIVTTEGIVTEMDMVFRIFKIDKTVIPFDDIEDIYGEGIIDPDDACMMDYSEEPKI